ncbi:hypothetical protein BCW_C0004 (plasmid) [Bacillus cereus W]|nr:hypothetical protein BCW_C0004 [Bacillus cereus W]
MFTFIYIMKKTKDDFTLVVFFLRNHVKPIKLLSIYFI